MPTKGRIEELRMIKRKDEIANISAAAKLTDQCFDFILGKIKIGVTETDIAWEIESFIRKNGASLAFSPIVAFGKNSSQPHYLRSVFARGLLQNCKRTSCKRPYEALISSFSILEPKSTAIAAT